MALGKYKLALRDYERVSKVRPNDKDAKAKFTECRKIVQQIAFNKAIAVDEKATSVAENLDMESMVVEDKYDGPRLSLASDKSEVSKVTVDFMDQLLEHYRDQKLLHRKYAFQILLDARTYFMAQPTLVNITVSQNFVVLATMLAQRKSQKMMSNNLILMIEKWKDIFEQGAV